MRPNGGYEGGMFGSLGPQLCKLGDDTARDYRRMYCGTCKALGDSYGLLARPLLSFDAVLLAAVIEGLSETPSAISSCRCPIMPVAHRSIIAPTSPAMEVAAAVQMLLTDQWLADHALDGRRGASLLRGLTEGRACDARASLEAIGVDTSAFEHLADRQVAIEQSSCDFSQAASPTADVLASVFGQIGQLPGVTADVAPESAEARSLAQLGHQLGVAVYALDALEDLEDDLRAGAFNPCVEPAGDLNDPKSLPAASRSRIDQVCNALIEALDVVAERLDTIPWRRNREILANIERQFRARCEAALRHRRAAISDSEPSAVSDGAPPPIDEPDPGPQKQRRSCWDSCDCGCGNCCDCCDCGIDCCDCCDGGIDCCDCCDC